MTPIHPRDSQEFLGGSDPRGPLVEGGQGKSAADVETSALLAGLAGVMLAFLVGVAICVAVWHAQHAGQAEDTLDVDPGREGR